MFLVTEAPLDPESAASSVRRDSNGAVVVFLGVVRNESYGKRIRYLEYDAYPEMAEKKMRQLAGEIEEQWGISDVAILHRTGRLEIGETSLVVVLAAPHRKEAFEACHHLVDRIKQVLPVWKKEVAEDGESWVEGWQVEVEEPVSGAG